MIDLDALCAAALRRLNTSAAISAGRHAGILRRRFAELRARLGA